MNYALWIQYDGTQYLGFQRQPKGKTVQAELERYLSMILNSDVPVHGAGRTDTGVHALQQVVNFQSPVQIDEKKIKNSLNSLLPDDILVTAIAHASEDFHSRYSAVQREYMYKILLCEKRNVFLHNRVWHVKEPVDIGRMKEAAQLIVGTHDFSSFSKKSDPKTNYVRTLDEISFDYDTSRQILTLGFKAQSFLHSMIRFITGELVLVGQGRHTCDYVKRMLESPDRSLIKLKAPPQGLYLAKIAYNETLNWDEEDNSENICA